LPLTQVVMNALGLSAVLGILVLSFQDGLGTAIAVLLDATIIRALLVPSLMQLIGRRAWWAPAPLRRLHARIRLSEAGPRSGTLHARCHGWNAFSRPRIAGCKPG
jgi:RND superfamily putative drug exporter